jgi:hypothetical protein
VKEESGLIVKPGGKILGVFDGFPLIRGEKCHVVRIYFFCETESTGVTLSNDHDKYARGTPQERHSYTLVGDLEEVIAAYTLAL